MLIYASMWRLRNDAEILQRLHDDLHARARHQLPLRRAGAAGTDETAGRHRHRALRPVRGADPGADGVSAHHPGTRQGGARTHQGYFGLWRKAVSTRNRTCSSAKAAQAPSPTASSTARSTTRAPRPQGAHRVRQGRRPARNPLCQQAPHRHLPAGEHGGEDARDHRGAGRRDPLSEPGRRHRYRQRPRCTACCWPTASASPRDHVVLAVGHSARDTFEMLYDRGVYIEAKPFSIGFRIEHPQSLIDRCRFGEQAGNPILGAADYKLVHHCGNGRSVYSFCMCPGGTVVAATSEPGRVVTNGMSQYSRNERNANSAHRRRHHPGRLSGRSAGRHRIPATLGEARLRAGRRHLSGARPAGRRLPGRPTLDAHSARCCRPTSRA